MDKNMITYIIKNNKIKYRYIVKSDGEKKQIFEIVCEQFGWKEKDCIIRKLNIFDYITNFFWRVIRKIKGDEK